MAFIYRPDLTPDAGAWTPIGLDRATGTSTAPTLTDPFAGCLADGDGTTFVRVDLNNTASTFIVTLGPEAGKKAAPGTQKVKVKLSVLASRLTNTSKAGLDVLCHNDFTIAVLGKDGAVRFSKQFQAAEGGSWNGVEFPGDIDLSPDDLNSLKLSVTAAAVGGNYRFAVDNVSVELGT